MLESEEAAVDRRWSGTTLLRRKKGNPAAPRTVKMMEKPCEYESATSEQDVNPAKLEGQAACKLALTPSSRLPPQPRVELQLAVCTVV